MEQSRPAQPVTELTSPGFWGSIREALGGSQQDFTTIPLRRAITLLAIPMAVEMAGESLFAICDAFFVARLGAESLATVGLTESLLFLVYSVAIGLSLATTAMVARRIGEKDPHGAAGVAVQAIALGLLTALILGSASAAVAPQLLRLMGASEAVVSIGLGYTQWMFGGMGTILLFFLINAAFRGGGDASSAMRALWFANGINVLLDPCLIFGLGPFPELGLTGAAVATNIGRGCGVLYQLSLLRSGRGRLTVRRADLRLQVGVALSLLRLALGGMGQVLVPNLSWIGLMRILAVYGSEVLAGYVIAMRIVIFALLPAFGLSTAAATLVGQNLGAGEPERAERAVWLTGLYNMVFLGSVTIVFLFLPGPLVALFSHDPLVVPTAVNCLRIVSYGYVFYAWEMVVIQAFNGAGDTVTPTLINVGCFWLFQLPLAFLLARTLEHGASGVFWAIALSYSLSAVVGMVIFRRGRWKKRQV